MYSLSLPEKPINRIESEPALAQIKTVINTAKEIFLELPEELNSIYVKRVVDGDTFIDGNNKRYRVAYIDAPESQQAFGDESYIFLKALLEKKELMVNELYLDKYDRTVAVVYLNNIDIAEILVEYGYAWNQASVYNAEQLYIEKMDLLETKAKQNNAGLWALENNVKPVEYRKGQKQDAVEKVYE